MNSIPASIPRASWRFRRRPPPLGDSRATEGDKRPVHRESAQANPVMGPSCRPPPVDPWAKRHGPGGPGQLPARMGESLDPMLISGRDRRRRPLSRREARRTTSERLRRTAFKAFGSADRCLAVAPPARPVLLFRAAPQITGPQRNLVPTITLGVRRRESACHTKLVPRSKTLAGPVRLTGRE